MYDLHDLQCLYFLLTQCVSSHQGSYRSIKFFVSQIATVLHKREPEDSETRESYMRTRQLSQQKNAKDT